MSKVEFLISEACYNISKKLRASLVKDAIEGKKAIIIVPDQFNFETEKAIYRAFGDKTQFFPNVKVTTFSKLTDEIIVKFGSKEDRSASANDITKTILMYRAINEVSLTDINNLTVFKNNAKKSGFAAKMYSTISMLKAAGYSARKFEKELNSVKEDLRDNNVILFRKLECINNVYKAFENQMLRFKYSDRLDRIVTAAFLAIENKYFSGKNFYFDKFSDFSERQMSFIRDIISTADNVTFAFTTNNSPNCRELFTNVNRTIISLADHANICNKPVIGQDILITENKRFEYNPAIEELSDNLYGTPSDNVDMSNITIIRADDVHDEADYVAAEIRRLAVLENKYKYNEIAVLAANPSDYKAAIESSFEKYEIPVFCDIPESILHMPLVNLVTSLLNVLHSFTIENILSYVKTGFLQKEAPGPDSQRKHVGITVKEISDFEEYLYIWGIDASDLSEADNRFPIPTASNRKEEIYRAENAELVRQSVLPPLLKLREELKHKCSGSEITQKICTFLFEEIGIERAIMAHCKKTGSSSLNDSDKEAVSSYQTLWNKMLEIFEALNSALGDGDNSDSGTSDVPKMSVGEYYHLFRDICTNTTLAQPPEVNDSVLVGDINRTRTENIKVIFIVGACYGCFPAEEKSNGILSEYEIELLSENELKLADNRTDRYCSEKYSAYIALTSPSDKLYITYPMLNISCAAMNPSEIVTQLCRDYNIKEKTTSDFGDDFYCTSRRAAQQRFAKYYNSDTTERATLKAALTEAKCSDFTKKLDRLAELRHREYNHNITPSTAEALFSNKAFSATNIEKLNDCRFKYFCAKGLRVNPVFRKDLNATNVGVIIHYILQRFLEMYCNDLDSFIKMTRFDMSNIVLELLYSYRKNELINSKFYNSERFVYLYENILSSAALDVLTILQTEFASRSYRPKFFELEISDNSTSCTSPVVNTDQPLDTADLANAELIADASNTGTPKKDKRTEYDDTNSNRRLTLNTKPYEICLDNNITIKITGNVDRVDTFTGTDGKEYMRVVDYKTGKRSFGIDKAYSGVSNQMLLYLIALSDANKDIKPGGVSYMPAMATDPDDTVRDSLNLLFGNHIQSGLLIKYPAPPTSPNAIDETKNEMDKFIENVTEYRKKKAPKEKQRYITSKTVKPTNVFKKDIYDEFADECIKQTQNTIQALYNGDVSAIPQVYRANEKVSRPCDYCSFKTICGYNINKEIMVSMASVPPKFHPVNNPFDEDDNADSGKTPAKSRSAKKSSAACAADAGSPSPLNINERKEDTK